MGKRRLVHAGGEAAASADSEQKDSADAGSNEDGEESSGEVRPIGQVIKKTGRGKSERRFYEAFELDSGRYNLEDSVLITPEEKSQKPYVAIIKEIKQSRDGSLAVTGQWFYRPEEAEKKGGGSWEADDARELFYSFHRDEVPAESVMHKCVVHFIPSHKKTPTRSKHPGFIVRKVYDTVEKKLWNLTDKDYEDTKQKEIDLLVQKTQQALGDLLDVEPEEVIVAEPDVERPARKTLRKKNPPLLNIPKDDTIEEGPATKPETPADASESKGYALLRQGGHLTRNKVRDRWLEKILQNVEFLYEAKQEQDPPPDDSGKQQEEKPAEKQQEAGKLFSKEAAIEAICALERAAHEAIADIHKYNLKMRSLDFNLKTHHLVTRRLFAKELDPVTVVNMTPAELKDGMTSAEKSAQEPQTPQMIQMANVRCSVCNERQVGVKDIIHAPHGDRYQLECLKCGQCWYSSRDAIAALETIPAAAVTPTVGAAPVATAKFEDAQKEIAAAHKEQENSEANNNHKEGDNTGKMDVDSKPNNAEQTQEQQTDKQEEASASDKVIEQEQQPKQTDQDKEEVQAEEIRKTDQGETEVIKEEGEATKEKEEAKEEGALAPASQPMEVEAKDQQAKPDEAKVEL